MTSKQVSGWMLGFAVVLAPGLSQPRGAGRGFAQPAGAREVTVGAIPGVVAAGAQWTLVWQGTENADGIVGTADGGLLFAQEQPSRVSKLDRSGKVSIFLENTRGAGALAIDSQGRILAAERTCTDPGGLAAQCKEPTAVAVLAPMRMLLADQIEGKSLGRLNDLMADKKGGVYFNGTGTYYVNRNGRVVEIGQNLRTNGILLSRDEKTLFVTNGGAILAFDIQPDGGVTNQREFARLEAGGAGDGMAIDSAGRLYVSSAPGIQVIASDGKYLGVIPSPREAISVAFSGTGKKTLYMVGSGALGPDGKEFRTPPGVRNNAKTIYKIVVQAGGFKGRAK